MDATSTITAVQRSLIVAAPNGVSVPSGTISSTHHDLRLVGTTVTLTAATVTSLLGSVAVSVSSLTLGAAAVLSAPTIDDGAVEVSATTASIAGSVLGARVTWTSTDTTLLSGASVRADGMADIGPGTEDTGSLVGATHGGAADGATVSTYGNPQIPTAAGSSGCVWRCRAYGWHGRWATS